MTKSEIAGLVTLRSPGPVDEMLAKTLRMLEQKGLVVFAVVDHSGEAEKRGLKMPPTKLVIFGDPKAGTPVMRAAPTSAIDLPLKILLWEDGEGGSWLSYNAPEYVAGRHGVPENLAANLSGIRGLAGVLVA
jgi:uncharacterized protein (DUF302 family)